MAKTSPAEFVRQVRQEVNKITFPTRRETMVSSAMVLVIGAVAAVFFLVTDNVIRLVVSAVLGIEG